MILLEDQTDRKNRLLKGCQFKDGRFLLEDHMEPKAKIICKFYNVKATNVKDPKDLAEILESDNTDVDVDVSISDDVVVDEGSSATLLSAETESDTAALDVEDSVDAEESDEDKKSW